MRVVGGLLLVLLSLCGSGAQGEGLAKVGEIREFQETAPGDTADESIGQTTKPTTPDIWAEVRALRDLVVELRVHLQLLQTENSDLQTRLSSSESELLKSRIDQLERENAGQPREYIKAGRSSVHVGRLFLNLSESAFTSFLDSTRLSVECKVFFNSLMAAVSKTFEHVKATILAARESTTPGEKINFYNSWAENYEQDLILLDYRSASLAVNSISSHFSGDREAAEVLDVACGTGLVAKQMKRHGFGHFVGIDGSEAMLMLARESGLYQDLKQSMLGEGPLPVQKGLFDVVVIVGALSVGQVPVCVVRELCKSTKPGGHVCMTTRNNQTNVEYKAALERELKQMEAEGLWACVEVAEVEDWERGVSEEEVGYISGAVYLYKKL